MSRIFGDIVQNGYVVRDIQAAMRHWIEVLGVGPWYYIERLPVTDFRYKGEPSPVDVSLALANSGALQVELIQQRNDAPSMYRDFLNAGHEGLQHIGYGTYNFEADLARLLSSGYTVGQSGQIATRGPFVYLQTEAHPGTVVEVFDLAGGRAQVFARIAAAARNWDGKDPIRTRLPTD
jgi:hypothetical protein